ncbi:MAG: ABC transporter C-terminal domain-containing protein, partial [Planctomycetota bacterium]|nr:ABC transporter C-terminal domain-containing protein [Planctomycetota bacterium]
IGDGKATHYPADYDTYLYRVEKEFDDAPATAGADTRPQSAEDDKQQRKKQTAKQRDARKQIASLERKIAGLDDRKRALNQQLLVTADAAEAQRLHEEVQNLQSEIESVEQRWFELQETAESH